MTRRVAGKVRGRGTEWVKASALTKARKERDAARRRACDLSVALAELSRRAQCPDLFKGVAGSVSMFLHAVQDADIALMEPAPWEPCPFPYCDETVRGCDTHRAAVPPLTPACDPMAVLGQLTASERALRERAEAERDEWKRQLREADAANDATEAIIRRHLGASEGEGIIVAAERVGAMLAKGAVFTIARRARAFLDGEAGRKEGNEE